MSELEDFDVIQLADALVLRPHQSVRCPYLPNHKALTVLRIPKNQLSLQKMDEHLDAGFRREGVAIYWNECEACDACEPLRIDVERFEFSQTHRRTLKRARRELHTEESEPLATPEHARLFDLHRQGRGLAQNETTTTLSRYAFLAASSCTTRETRVFRGNELISVSLFDIAETSHSAVMCFYNPAWSHYGLGTLSILRQIERCKAENRRYLYLGLYVEGCDALAYKARYLPHERLIKGKWTSFEP